VSDLPESRRSRIQPERRRARAAWIILVIVLVVLCVLAWVGVRGYLATKNLQDSVGLVGTLKTQIASADTAGATATAKELEQRADAAKRETSDPVWRAVEYTPFVGSNLTDVRQVASIIADVAENGVQPAATALQSLDLAKFAPVNGKIDLQPLVTAKPAVDRATATLQRALANAKRIDTSKAVSQVDAAVDQLTDTLQTVSLQADTADRFVDIAPAMLGNDGPKNYLLLFENNAELRAGGGIPGAVALVHADGGSIELQQQASGASFGLFQKSPVNLSTETRGLYGDVTGQYMQNVTKTPRFDVSAKLAKAMWAQKYGTQVDGVIAIDPVTLGYILGATGPVTLPTGDTLNSDNAVSLLLSDVYARYPDPAVQDAFFAGAASSVFQKVSSGGFDAKALIAALAKGVSERRVMLWSADPAKQKVINGTAVAGELPKSTLAGEKFGVYLNDATGAKMDYYLTKQVAVGTQVCRADGRPTWTVEVTLKNTAPADAATRLPEYVTGGGDFGVPPGVIRTEVAVYGPSSGSYLSATQDGKPSSAQTAEDGKYFVVQFDTLLSPGKTTTLRAQFVGPVGSKNAPVAVEQTAGVHVTVTNPMAKGCEK
jgi:cell division protein FtsB